MSSTAASTPVPQNISTRLTRYAVVASAIPVASASAGLVTDSFSSPVVVSNGNPVDVDFGAQFGEVFRFTFNRYTDFDTNFYTYFGDQVIYRFSSAANALMNFNNSYYYNTGAITPPSYAYFVNSNPAFGYYGGNNPARFGNGQVVSSGLNFYYFDYFRGSDHDLFRKGFSYSVTNYGSFEYGSSSFGAWRPGQRGFLLFAFYEDEDPYFGYFDVGLSPNGQSMLIYGWAFNDQSGGAVTTQPLPTPGPVGLAVLALGAAGVRRKRREAPVQA